MKKRLLWIAVIIVAVVIIPITVFQTIKLVTRPASITLEEAQRLPLEEGQMMVNAGYDEVYEWATSEIRLNVEDTDWVPGYAHLVISNDFFIRHFQDLEKSYVIIVQFTGEENRDGFPIVVADAWYVLED